MLKVKNMTEAWDLAKLIFPTDYEKDEERSLKAGYPVYGSTAEGRHYDYICDLNDRLEINLANSNRIVNIWVEQTVAEQKEEEKIAKIKYKTIREAAEEWVEKWDFIQAGLIQDAINGKEYVWNELTPLTAGNPVCFWDGTNLKGETYDGHGEIEKVNKEKVIVRVSGTDDKIVVDKNRVEVERRNWFPMWNILFQTKDSACEYFIRDNLQKVADCGFRIYEHDDYGIYLGIDGSGYDFYKEHWIPLYKAVGM